MILLTSYENGATNMSALLISPGLEVRSVQNWIEIGIVKFTKAFLLSVTAKAPTARNT